MFLGMGPLELIIILGIALLIFGPKRLPKLGKTLGETVKSVREGMDGDEEDEKKPEPARIEAAEVEDIPAPVAEPVAEPVVEPVAERVAEPVAEPVAEAVAETAEEEVRFCNECGAKNPATAKFCNDCGAKLS